MKVKKRNRLQTKNRVLLAVEEVIARNGLEKEGINVIAKQADTNKVLIYRYFGGRNGVVEAWLHQFLTRLDRLPLGSDSALTPQEWAKYLGEYTLHYYQEFRSNLAWQQVHQWLQGNQETELARCLLSLQKASGEHCIRNLIPASDPVLGDIHRLVIGGLSQAVLMDPSATALTDQQISAMYGRIGSSALFI